MPNETWQNELFWTLISIAVNISCWFIVCSGKRIDFFLQPYTTCLWDGVGVGVGVDGVIIPKFGHMVPIATKECLKMQAYHGNSHFYIAKFLWPSPPESSFTLWPRMWRRFQWRSHTFHCIFVYQSNIADWTMCAQCSFASTYKVIYGILVKYVVKIWFVPLLDGYHSLGTLIETVAEFRAKLVFFLVWFGQFKYLLMTRCFVSLSSHSLLIPCP